MLSKSHSLRYSSKKLVDFFDSNTFLYITLAWFIIQAVYIAVSTKFGVPPDEAFHFHLIKLYAERSLDPFLNNQEGYFFLGEVTRYPQILYHYLMSWPFRLVSSFDNSFIVLRFINVGMAVVTLGLVKQLGRQLKISTASTNLSIFMLAGTLMFTFLAASINYDNLVILLSLLSLSLLISLLYKFNSRLALSYILVLTIGSLVKNVFLPLAALETIVLVLYYRATLWQKIKAVLRALIKRPRTLRDSLVIVALLLSLVIFVERFGGNLVRYGSLYASCTEVHELQDCEKSSIFRRNRQFFANAREPSISPTRFVTQWSLSMKRKVFGIMAHKSTEEPKLLSYGTFAVIGLMTVGAIVKFKPEDKPKNAILLIAAGYTLILLLVNYKTYLNTGLYGLALQGRYIFPVLPALYLLGNHYIENMFKTMLFALYALLILLIFIPAGVVSYIYSTTPDWHTDFMKNINSNWRGFLLRLRF